MDDLRSLEGVGQLLQAKVNQKRHKLRPRYHVQSPPTPSTPSSTISEYFPPEIANILGNAIQSGYHRKCIPQAPMLRKSHSAIDYRNDVNLSSFTPRGLWEEDEEEEEEDSILSINLPADDSGDFTTAVTGGDHVGFPPFPQSLQHFGKMNSIDNLMDEDDDISSDLELQPFVPSLAVRGIRGSDESTREMQSKQHLHSDRDLHCYLRQSSPDLGPLLQPCSLDLYPVQTELTLSPGCKVESPLGTESHRNAIVNVSTHSISRRHHPIDCNANLDNDRSQYTNEQAVEMNIPSPLTTITPLDGVPCISMRSPISRQSSSGSSGSSGMPLALRMKSSEMNMLSAGDGDSSYSMDNAIHCDVEEVVEEEEEADAQYINLREEYMECGSLKQTNGLSNIGNGASGIVSKAFHYKSCQMVALKHLKSRQIHEMTCFNREAALYRQFENNSNIINMQQFLCDETTENLCISMEFMDLGSTDRLQMDKISMTDRELAVAHIMEKTLRALKAVHERGYVHNDVKPANILCNKYGEVKLSDFGTAKRMRNPKSYLTKNCGTQRYQAPEKLMKRTKYNTKADIWSLGISCFELLVGPRTDGKELSYVTDPPVLDPEKDGVSPLCCDFLRMCLAPNDETRPSAEQLLEHEWIGRVCTVPLGAKWPWLVEVGGNGEDEALHDEDLLFMIVSMVAYYSKQSVDFQRENVASSRHRQSEYTDQQRLSNMARFALCSTRRVVERIRATVANIKSSLNKADISRIDS